MEPDKLIYSKRTCFIKVVFETVCFLVRELLCTWIPSALLKATSSSISSTATASSFCRVATSLQGNSTLARCRKAQLATERGFDLNNLMKFLYTLPFIFAISFAGKNLTSDFLHGFETGLLLRDDLRSYNEFNCP